MMSVGLLTGMKRVCLFFALLAAASAHARVIPAADNSAEVPDIEVMDDGGGAVSLRSMLAAMGGGPVVVLPIYTNCAVSCPLQTRKLKQALASLNSGGALRILVFSFDAADTSTTIEQYRKREGVPENWKVVTAREDEILDFFRFFQYSIMDDKGQFIHPDQIFLLDPSLRWRFTLTGVIWSPSELGHAIDQARSPGILGWISSHPSALAWAGFLCVLLSIGSLWIWLIRFKTGERSVAL